MRNKTTIVLLACLFALVLAPAVANAISPPVDFPDPALDGAVRAAIGKPAGQIYESDLTTLTALSANSKGITNIDGIEHATALTELQLSSNNITTITPVANLTNLQVLNVSWNSVVDVGPVQNLTQLHQLYFNHNKISSVSALSNLTGLTTLWLGQNSIADLTPLAGLTNVTNLDLSYNPVLTDLSPIAGLTNLTQLNLFNDDNLADLSPLSAMTKIGWINVSWGQVWDITPLGNLAASSGGTLICQYSWLDLDPLSPNSTAIATLRSRGYSVSDVPQRDGGALQGTVHDPWGAPLSGASVVVSSGPQAESAFDGSYRIRLLPTGERKLTISKPYYYSWVATFSASAGTTYTFDATLTPEPQYVYISRAPSASSLTYRRRNGVAKFTWTATLYDVRGRLASKRVYLQRSSNGHSWSTLSKLTTGSTGKASRTFRATRKGVTYYRWYSPATSYNQARYTAKQKVTIK